MSLFDFDVASFAYDLFILTLAFYFAGLATIYLARFFVESIIPGYDPTGYKKRMNDYLLNKMTEERKE
tara:strand:+ start:343 stop:546 length:204 start_codon:yes stop_codon:yes gene_type:complete